MLNVLYSFVCEEALPQLSSENNYDLTAVRILDQRLLDIIPTKLSKPIFFVAGLTGEPEDNGIEVILKIHGKETSLELPFMTFEFKEYDRIIIIRIAFGDFPITTGGTIYFELIHKNNVLSKYPVKFSLREAR